MKLSSETLFYSERDYRRVIGTLERLSRHILCKFVIVGGIANRAMFPEWGEMNQGKKFNDLDVVLMPSAEQAVTPLVSSSLKEDFFVNYISQQYDGYYFSTIDRHDHVGVDIYTRAKNSETTEVNINGKKYFVLTKEERYLQAARDIYESLTRTWSPIMDPKHIQFLAFLKSKVVQKKILELWPLEEPTIRFGRKEYPFVTIEEYFQQINRLIVERKERIQDMIPGKQPKKYGNSPLSEAWGITIEDEAGFLESNRLKRQYW